MTTLFLLHGGTGICWLEVQQLLQFLPWVGPALLMLFTHRRWHQ